MRRITIDCGLAVVWLLSTNWGQVIGQREREKNKRSSVRDCLLGGFKVNAEGETQCRQLYTGNQIHFRDLSTGWDL